MYLPVTPMENFPDLSLPATGMPRLTAPVAKPEPPAFEPLNTRLPAVPVRTGVPEQQRFRRVLIQICFARSGDADLKPEVRDTHRDE